MFSRVSFRVLILWLSSMTFLLYVCIFQNSLVFLYCSTFRLYNFNISIIYFIYYLLSRDKYRVLSVRYIIYNHRQLCLWIPEINIVSVMYDISTIFIVVYVCVFHSSIPYLTVRHIIHDHTSLYVCVFHS